MAAVLLLGFSSGLPLALTTSTLQAWMKTENIDLKVIGLFSLVGLPYALKFLWSPVMDRFVPPFLGRRRGWILVCQLALIASILGMSSINPAKLPFLTAIFAVFVSFSSASQDIVIDAYRTDVAEKDEIGPGVALYTLGYRVAMLISGSLALILADHLPWRTVYFLMAGAMTIGVITCFFSPEPTAPLKAPKTLGEAVVMPFLEFFRRRGSTEVIGFILLYKLDVVMALAMSTPFMLELGFTKTDIGAVTKGFGLIATILGTTLGGGLMVRLGVRRSLWVFGLSQSISNLSFMLLAHLGHHYPMMVIAIAVENMCSGMGTAAYTAFLMSLCDQRFTATQYALLTSLMALTRVVGGVPTGFLVENLGWEKYFLLCTLVAAPSLLILTRYSKWILPLGRQQMEQQDAT